MHFFFIRTISCIITFSMTGGSRQQKLLLLFHACIPHKQIKAVLQQSGSSSSFPSYLFELGLESFDASLLSVDSPSRNTELCGLEVSRPVAADILASLLLSTQQQQQQNAHSQKHHQSPPSFQMSPVPPILSQFTNVETDISNSSHHNTHQSMITTVPQFTQLYNACCDEPKSLKFHEFVQWLTEEVGIGAAEEGDDTLDRIMCTLLLNDTVLSAESERQMMETLWTEWQEYNNNELPATKLSHAPSSVNYSTYGAQNNNNGVDNNEVNGTITANSTTNENEGAEATSVITNGTVATAVSTTSATTTGKPSHAKKKSGLWGFVSNAQHISTNGGSSSAVSLSSRKANGTKPSAATTAVRRTFGGIGNFDGRGGLGNGVLYCVDKSWWDKWIQYVGWSSDSSGTQEEEQQQEGLMESRKGPPPRPPPLSNEALIAPSAHDECGTQGSFEAMKPGLEQNKDYVLVPPPVWDTLYLLYGGGPPLPRMIDNNNSVTATAESTTTTAITPPNTKEEAQNENNGNHEECSNDTVNSGKDSPSASMPLIATDVPLSVVVKPWVISCQMCDPLQPYRRGEAGPLSIRVMATPGQPFWRFLAELVMRLPITNPRARDASGNGHARLWRKVDATTAGDANNKYLTNGSR
jgi:hypothetical protein